MAGRGPAPGTGAKDPSLRRRRNKPDPIEVIVGDGEVRGPDLPDVFEWPEQTLAWWKIWRTSAQAKTLTDTDWSFLLDTAILHAEFWLGNRTVAAELRLRVAKFGATPEDRARLKIEVEEPGVMPTTARLKTKDSVDRRARLLRAVGDGGSAGQ